MRPSSREHSSSRGGDERSPRPARPRLNRESVDRAWESGAPSRHADYRTRSNNGNRGQAPRNNWNGNSQNGQNRPGGQYPARNNYNGHPDRPSYGDRPAGPRRFDTPTGGNQRPPSRPFDSNNANSANRRNENSRPGPTHRPYANEPRPQRPESRDHSRPYEPRPSFRDNGQGGGFQRRNIDHTNYNDRGPRPYARNNRSDGSHGSHDSNYGGRPPRNFDRDTRAPGNSYRDTRSPRNAEPSETLDTRNPRWRSRPAAQQPQPERYKGDYERYDSPEEKPRFAGRPSHKYDAGKPRRYESNKPKPAKKELHVTPLPDGRVLKGPRPVQRKNAEFWTDIAQNTDALLNGVKEVTTPQEQPTDDSVVAQELLTHDNDVAQEPSTQEPLTDDSIVAQELLAHDSPGIQEQVVTEKGTPPATKTRKRATTAVSRSKKASEKQKGAQPKTKGPVPRPSRRGFKWPTPE